jgi:hypothetical protein
MADDTDDPEAAADRLDAALERIAQLIARLRPGHAADAGGAAMPADANKAARSGDADEATRSADADESSMSPDEIAARLDMLIGRLRSALGRQGG